MSPLIALRLALRALGRNKLRATLTVLGILIGVASVVTMTALGAGAKARLEAQMATLGVNMLVVYPNGTVSGGARSAIGSAVGLTEDDVTAVLREVPSVAAAAPVLGASVQLVAGARNASTRVTGTTPAYLTVRSWKVTTGAGFSDEDVRRASRVCVLGETVRQELFGDEPAVGQEIRVGRMPCVVVGVLEAKGQSGFGQDQDDTILVPISTTRTRLARRPGKQINTAMISARDPALTHRAETAINELLRQRHHTEPGSDPDFSVRNMADLAKSFDEQTQTLTLLLLAVASISLLVGGIGVMNIMLVSVTERTREIGIRLAIGARAADIRAQFLVEAIVLSAIGGLAGLGLGVLASTVLASQTGWSVKFQPGSAAVAMAVAGGIGVVFGFFPAQRASRLDPIVALRHE